MLNPLYLVASRHGLYYFRFPIAAQFHPEGKRSSLRLSLGTRCPKEALHLTRGLCYVGEHVLSHMKATQRDYNAIRSFLMQFFKERLQVMQETMAMEGQLPESMRQAYENTHHFSQDALKTKWYALEGTDEQLNAIADAYSLPLRLAAEVATCNLRGVQTPPEAAGISRNDASLTFWSGRRCRMSSRKVKGSATVFRRF